MTYRARVLAGLALCCAVPLGVAGSPCDCRDIYDLESRQAKAEAAIAEYNAVISEWGENPPPAEEASRRPLQDRVNSAMIKAGRSDALSASAETTAGCQPVLHSAGSACMASVVMAHEGLHVPACKKTLFSRWDDLAEYAREEIEGYQLELRVIAAELERLRSGCSWNVRVTMVKNFDNGCLEYRQSGELTVKLGETFGSGRAVNGQSFFTGPIPMTGEFCRLSSDCDEPEVDRAAYEHYLKSPTCASPRTGQAIAVLADVDLTRRVLTMKFGLPDQDASGQWTVTTEDFDAQDDMPDIPCAKAMCEGLEWPLIDGWEDGFEQPGELGSVSFIIKLIDRAK